MLAQVQVKTAKIVEVTVGIPSPARIRSNVENYVSSQQIARYRAIKVVGGIASICSGDILADVGLAVGISVLPAPLGKYCQVQTNGSLINNLWNWASGPIFVGIGGELVQQRVGLSFTQQIAIAVSPVEIIINPQLGIING